MEQKFDAIIEKGEEVLNIFKPDKLRFWSGWVIGMTITATVFMLLPLFSLFALFRGPDLFWLIFGISLPSMGGLVVLCILISFTARKILYKNTFYAYSNKRIMIRAGIIGVDYKSLEFRSLNATIVWVGLLDKLMRRNTGDLKFGSPASPVLAVEGLHHTNQFLFRHVKKPYETMREIKEFMNTVGH